MSAEAEAEAEAARFLNVLEAEAGWKLKRSILLVIRKSVSGGGGVTLPAYRSHGAVGSCPGPRDACIALRADVIVHIDPAVVVTFSSSW